MAEVVRVKLRSAGEVKCFLSSGMKFEENDKVIVESDRGLEYGEVITSFERKMDDKHAQSLRKIIRKANPWDQEQITKNKAKTRDLMNICMHKIKEHKLDMKLVDAEYSFDRSKIIFYFTSDNRVDFRKLVKDLASIFRVRIELKQIGVRDEAKMVGGCGSCGRELCCSAFLANFETVTIKMAKVQNLPLNPSKISGLCGRLMCCLGYENETYKSLSKSFPKVGREIKTKHGTGKVVGVNPINAFVTVDLGNGIIKHIKYEAGKNDE